MGLPTTVRKTRAGTGSQITYQQILSHQCRILFHYEVVTGLQSKLRAVAWSLA